MSETYIDKNGHFSKDKQGVTPAEVEKMIASTPRKVDKVDVVFFTKAGDIRTYITCAWISDCFINQTFGGRVDSWKFSDCVSTMSTAHALFFNKNGDPVIIDDQLIPNIAVEEMRDNGFYKTRFFY